MQRISQSAITWITWNEKASEMLAFFVYRKPKWIYATLFFRQEIKMIWPYFQVKWEKTDTFPKGNESLPASLNHCIIVPRMEYTSNVELVAERARALINYIWIFLIVVGFGVGIATGRLEDVTNAALDSATSAAQLSLSRHLRLMAGASQHCQWVWLDRKNRQQNAAGHPLFISGNP